MLLQVKQFHILAQCKSQLHEGGKRGTHLPPLVPGAHILSFDISILMFSDFNFQVADFGGTLGVFIGFSFITVWDGMVVLAAAAAKLKILFFN